jgi:hypothetical protein
MDTPSNAADLSQEQQDTASLLDRLLGKAIADRYVDFCRLAAGAFRIKVSRPLTAHALRELDSTLRHVLAVPMEAKAPEPPENADQLDEVRKRLSELHIEPGLIQRAVDSLKPRISHKTQIRKIVARLGLDPEGDIAKRWIAVSDSAGKAHERSFHRSLAVDDQFRSKYQQPFDTVIRAIATALEGRYTALMRRVEEIAAMPLRSEAVAAFASEIPGALPLQWHFFKSLTTSDWLPHLAQAGLLGEPLDGPEEASAQGFRRRQWPAGDYLRRMAAAPDAATRKLVAEALRKLAPSTHPDVQQDGIDVIGALPADEGAQLAGLAVRWLGREARFSFLRGAEDLMNKLANAGQKTAALDVARALFQVWDENGSIATLHGRHMYEHHLSEAIKVLTTVGGEDALRLFMDLLVQTGNLSGRLQSDHHSSYPIADESMAKVEAFSALKRAVRTSAEQVVASDPTTLRKVIGILASDPAKVLTRIALHVLAQNPAAAPDLAEAYLLNSDLIEQSWAREEYAALARAWFPSLVPEKQRAILALVDAMPDKFRANFRMAFERNHRIAPTVEDERIYEAVTVRDALWKWRSVLPPERQAALEKIGAEHGSPDAWPHRFMRPEESPLEASDFSSRSVPDVIKFLKSWQPQQGAQQRQTVTALAQELRVAVGNAPERYAADADQFVSVKPIYLRRLFEGLQNAASNLHDIKWDSVLKLIEHTLGQRDQTIDPATLADGDDKTWEWACKSAGELLSAGLRVGDKSIPFEHAAQVQRIVLQFLDLAPKIPEIEDFKTRFRRSPYFLAQSTWRGLAAELCIILMWWLSRDATGPIGSAPRQALENLPEIRAALDAELTDRSLGGWIPRAIMGRWLRLLCLFGEDWLKAKAPELLPVDEDELRHAAWWSHLGHDEAPLVQMMDELRGSYAETISRLPANESDQDVRELLQNRLAEYIVLLHLWDALPDDLLNDFCKSAPDAVRRHAMWFVGELVSGPATEDRAKMKARGLKYWERRLAAAIQSGRPDEYRGEIGSISHWCFHDQVDEAWMGEQLVQMLPAGFVPNDAYDVIEWLKTIAPNHIDRAVEVMQLLLRNPRIDRWAYMTKREPIREVLSDGLARGTTQTIERVNQVVGFLSSIGETSYLDLVRTPAK